MTPLALASLLLIPQSITAAPQQTFTISIEAFAASSTGTIEAHIAFDPKLLAAERVSLAPGWIEVNEPGYKSLDTKNGVVVETAGYPGGFTGTTTFASITFLAKAAGNATIAPAGDTLMLNAKNENEFGGNAGGTLVTIRGAGKSGIFTIPTAAPANGAAVGPLFAPEPAGAAFAPRGLISWLKAHLHL